MRKKYKQRTFGTKPPKTKRYCLSCKRATKFEYNRNIGHSECTQCGGRKARRTTT